MVDVSRYAVAEYLRRATVVGITRPVPPGLDDVALERKLFTPPEALRRQPDWPRIHAGLRKPGVTLSLMWEDYRAGQREGYGYSRFCDLPQRRGRSDAGRSSMDPWAGWIIEGWNRGSATAGKRCATSGPRASPATARPCCATLTACATRSRVRCPIARGRWGSEETSLLARLREAAPTLATAVTLAEEFAALVRGRKPERLDPWLQRAQDSAVPALQRFANGCRRTTTPCAPR